MSHLVAGLSAKAAIPDPDGGAGTLHTSCTFSTFLNFAGLILEGVLSSTGAAVGCMDALLEAVLGETCETESPGPTSESSFAWQMGNLRI